MYAVNAEADVAMPKLAIHIEAAMTFRIVDSIRFGLGLVTKICSAPQMRCAITTLGRRGLGGNGVRG